MWWRWVATEGAHRDGAMATKLTEIASDEADANTEPARLYGAIPTCSETIATNSV